MSPPDSMPFPSMEMTEEELDAIIKQFHTKVPERDRRKHEREQCCRFAVLVTFERPDGAPTFLMELTENISRGGLAFKHSSRLVLGLQCNVEIMLPSGGTVKSRGRIVHCHRHQEGGYVIGVALERLLSACLIAP